jgi:NAD(P) transhydrogenase
VGAGIIGVEYAGMFAALGARVTLVDQRVTFLEFLDAQIRDCLEYHMQNHGIELRLGEEVVGFELRGDVVVAKTRSNKELAADCVLYSIGRQGNTEYLNLEAAGLSADKRGRIKVNEHYQTGAPHIYAAGDVIGFPALSATSREQGRRAMCHAFDVLSQAEPLEMPFGIWTIPEISAIGPTERELTEEAVPYEIGIARYREIARGQIVGDTDGTLKILFHRETLKVLAVHIIGEGAADLVHIGQVAVTLGGTLDYFIEAVFNHPTLAECYKVAALDGLNRVRSTQGLLEASYPPQEQTSED